MSWYLLCWWVKMINITEDSEHTIIKAVNAAREAAYNILRDDGYEIVQEGCIIHSEIYDKVMWAFIRTWGGYGNSPYLKLVDFEGLFYPGFEGRYEGQTIPKQVAELILERAKSVLEIAEAQKTELPSLVKEHLTSIINNGMPYGVKVEDELE